MTTGNNKKSLFERIEDNISIFLLIFFVIWGNGRIIYTSLTSTNGDEYLILYYPIAYLLTYCMPWLFPKDLKYEDSIVKIFCKLAVMIFFGSLGCMI